MSIFSSKRSIASHCLTFSHCRKSRKPIKSGAHFALIFRSPLHSLTWPSSNSSCMILSFWSGRKWLRKKDGRTLIFKRYLRSTPSWKHNIHSWFNSKVFPARWWNSINVELHKKCSWTISKLQNSLSTSSRMCPSETLLFNGVGMTTIVGSDKNCARLCRSSEKH